MNKTEARLGLPTQKPCARSTDFRSTPGCFGPTRLGRPNADRFHRQPRTGSVFAFAPFIGAEFAVALGDRSTSGLMALDSGLMLAGVVLHLAESHGHEHEHEALEHEHVRHGGRMRDQSAPWASM